MALQEGLYNVEFQARVGRRNVVIVVENGKIRGVDCSMMYYDRIYVEDGSTFSATAKVYRHATVAGIGSVFGVTCVNIAITGTATATSAQMTGTAPQARGVRVSASLTKLS